MPGKHLVAAIAMAARLLLACIGLASPAAFSSTSR